MNERNGYVLEVYLTWDISRKMVPQQREEEGTDFLGLKAATQGSRPNPHHPAMHLPCWLLFCTCFLVFFTEANIISDGSTSYEGHARGFRGMRTLHGCPLSFSEHLFESLSGSDSPCANFICLYVHLIQERSLYFFAPGKLVIK